MVRLFRERLREVHGSVAVVTFLATGLLLHVAVPTVALLSTTTILYFTLGAVAAAAVIGSVGTALQRGIATLLGRAEINPRTATAARYAKIIAVALLGVDALLAVGFTWITFRVAYSFALS